MYYFTLIIPQVNYWHCKLPFHFKQVEALFKKFYSYSMEVLDLDPFKFHICITDYNYFTLS